MTHTISTFMVTTVGIDFGLKCEYVVNLSLKLTFIQFVNLEISIFTTNSLQFDDMKTLKLQKTAFQNVKYTATSQLEKSTM